MKQAGSDHLDDEVLEEYYNAFTEKYKATVVKYLKPD